MTLGGITKRPCRSGSGRSYLALVFRAITFSVVTERRRSSHLKPSDPRRRLLRFIERPSMPRGMVERFTLRCHPSLSAAYFLLGLDIFPFFVSIQPMTDWLAIIILGIIEGITEFLPISSTAHLLIAEQWLPRQSDLFNIVIQSGAVIAVLPLFPKRLYQFVFGWREKSTRDYALKILLAFVITGIGGLVLDRAGFELPEELWPIAWALLLGGIGFLIIELWLKGRHPHETITWTIAAAVGVGQLLAAVFPGTSRSGSTILLMLFFGLNRPAATEFSFLVGIPTMLAAGGLKIYRALFTAQTDAASEQWGMVLLGFLVSAAVSFVAVKWLLGYVRNNTFSVFGWYRIALAAVIFLSFFVRLKFKDIALNTRDIHTVVRILKEEVAQWQTPVVGHYADSPFTVLVSCLLSLRTQDKTTHAASERLFQIARDPQKMAEIPTAESKKSYIRSVSIEQKHRTSRRSAVYSCNVTIAGYPTI